MEMVVLLACCRGGEKIVWARSKFILKIYFRTIDLTKERGSEGALTHHRQLHCCRLVLTPGQIPNSFPAVVDVFLPYLRKLLLLSTV